MYGLDKQVSALVVNSTNSMPAGHHKSGEKRDSLPSMLLNSPTWRRCSTSVVATSFMPVSESTVTSIAH